MGVQAVRLRFVRREIGEIVEFSALWRFARGDGYG